VRQIGKLSVGRVGTTCGDVYQGRIMAADSADGIDYRVHTHMQTPTVGENKLLSEPRGSRQKASIARSSETLLAVYDKKKKKPQIFTALNIPIYYIIYLRFILFYLNYNPSLLRVGYDCIIIIYYFPEPKIYYHIA